MAKWRRGLSDQRGASLTEYVLVGFLLLMVVGVAFKALGGRGREAVSESHKTFSGDSTTPAGQGGSPNVGGSHDKASVAMKVSIANGAAKTKAMASDIGSKAMDEASQIELEFSFKKLARWLAVAIAALGIGVGFSVYKRGRAEAATAESEAPDTTGPNATGIAPRNIAPGNAPTKYTD